MSDLTLVPAGRQWNAEMEQWEPVTRINNNDPIKSLRNSGSSSSGGADALGALLVLLVLGSIFILAYYIVHQIKRFIRYQRNLRIVRQTKANLRAIAPVKFEGVLAAARTVEQAYLQQMSTKS